MSNRDSIVSRILVDAVFLICTDDWYRAVTVPV
jgi:hypothetical protein